MMQTQETAMVAALRAVEREPVNLKRTDLAFIKVGGNMPSYVSIRTHATKDEILSPGWFDSVGDLIFVDDTLNIYYGPHPFDRDEAAGDRANYRGGARPHERLSLYVIGKEPKRNERNGRIAGWSITVRLD